MSGIGSNFDPSFARDQEAYSLTMKLQNLYDLPASTLPTFSSHRMMFDVPEMSAMDNLCPVFLWVQAIQDFHIYANNSQKEVSSNRTEMKKLNVHTITQL